MNTTEIIFMLALLLAGPALLVGGVIYFACRGVKAHDDEKAGR